MGSFSFRNDQKVVYTLLFRLTHHVTILFIASKNDNRAINVMKCWVRNLWFCKMKKTILSILSANEDIGIL